MGHVNAISEGCVVQAVTGYDIEGANILVSSLTPVHDKLITSLAGNNEITGATAGIVEG